MRSWRELLAKLDPDATLRSPAGESDIAEAERRLGVRLPDELRSLLAESDGAFDKYQCAIVWPLDQIVADNEDYRRNPIFAQYMPVDDLLFFADAGDGELFGYSISRVGEVRDHVFVWNPIEDSRMMVAGSLGGWLQGWLGGSLTI